MTKPFQKLFELTKTAKIIWLGIGILGTLLIELVYTNMSVSLVAHGFDILDFEFAWNKVRMDAILTGWQPIITTAINFLLLDMLFPIFYTMLFTGITILLKGGKQTQLRCVAVGVFILAAIFDWIENVFSLLILYSPSNYVAIYVLLVSLFATLKFSLLVIGLVLSFF